MQQRTKAAAALAVFLTLAPFSPASAGGSRLNDLTGHWAEVPVSEAVSRGYVSGYPDGSFKPDQPVSRAEFLAMAAKAFSFPRGEVIDGAMVKVHPDLVIDHWFIRQGFGANQLLSNAVKAWQIQPGEGLRFDEVATRGEVAAAAYLLVSDRNPVFESRRSQNPALSKLVLERTAVRFPDLKAWDQNRSEKLATKAVAEGLLVGFGEGRFAPAEPVTRAQAVVILERALKSRTPMQWNFFNLPDTGVPTYMVAANGTLWARLYNTLTPVPGLRDVVAVTAAGNAALKHDGTVWDLKFDYARHQPVAAKVAGISDAVAIAAYGELKIVTKRDGTAWVWGSYADFGDGSWCSHAHFCLPVGKNIAIKEPTQLSGLAGVVSIGEATAVTQDGSVWQWAPTGAPRRRPQPGKAVENFLLTILQADGTVWDWDRNADDTLVAHRVEGLTDIAMVGMTKAVKRDGTVWDLATGKPGNLTGVVAIGTTALLKADGTFMIWSAQAGWSIQPLGAATVDDTGDSPDPDKADLSWVIGSAREVSSHTSFTLRQGREPLLIVATTRQGAPWDTGLMFLYYNRSTHRWTSAEAVNAGGCSTPLMRTASLIGGAPQVVVDMNCGSAGIKTMFVADMNADGRVTVYDPMQSGARVYKGNLTVDGDRLVLTNFQGTDSTSWRWDGSAFREE